MKSQLASRPKTTPAQLQAAFEQAFSRTEQLFDLITKEAYWARPIPLRHPINFYEGHLPAFAWNTLFRRALNLPSFNPAFDRLFARGIDPRDQPTANTLAITEWPEREAVRDYKKTIQEKLLDFIQDEKNWQRPDCPILEGGALLWLILEHELMHQETLLYMFHQLPHESKRPPHGYQSHSGLDSPEPPRQRVEVPAGTAYLGASKEAFSFAWDNELPLQAVHVDAFTIDAYPVTNGRFLEFVEAGGYSDRRFWTEKSWQWKEERKLTHPFFWKKQGQRWLLRDLFEDIPLPLSRPVYVTHAEAEAYAKFANQALPSEAEWQRVAFGDEKDGYINGHEFPNRTQGNFGFQSWSPVPVGQFPLGCSRYGVHDLFGNAWEWTCTPFTPFSGFSPSTGYPEYSADFFDGQHYVVKGGSHFTDPLLLRQSFRNWFYWHYPYAYITFRCVSR